MINKYTKKKLITKKELKKLYINKKMTYKEIAKLKGFSIHVIQNRIKEYNIKPRIAAKRNQLRENNCMWKGGKIKTEKGYVYIKTDNHPHKTQRGYVAEHILIMESYIKRYLKIISFNNKYNEVIHHINGIKDDNRIENLKLMTHSEHLTFHNKGCTYINNKRLKGVNA